MEHKIFHLCSGIRPGGGPAGYLYNLHQSSKSIHANFIVDDSNESKIRSNTSYNKIKNIPHSPYSYRKRNNSENSTTRELIFKGYTIPFEIDEKNNKIIILGIFNQNLWN